ncbi:hypothetical protein JAAARDRAFT_128809 [Jaapia argillacea MUCL 33604]|uniref:Lipid droplet-associated perilipin protein n=1 Tax=Jaapia argillacea MUCL 33604 TaxID=933084 RepID=A0A067Q495_9AGAM|nr:hypothetical protein JAAARDRAFT_128809 [Jaapia argillacea MUCL 33604]
MATETQTESQPAQLTVLNRIYSIPLINDSLTTLDSYLAQNAYTQRPYATAQGLTQTAYHRLGEPLQVRLAPILVKADGYANAGLDVVEKRYPYPFQVKTEEIVKHVRETSDHARDVVDKTIEERVRSPVVGVAQGIDQRFAPLVDVYEVYVNKIHSSAPESPSSPSTDAAQYQYQRAYCLTKNLRDTLYVYSNEQIKQLQSQSVLVQRATATAQNISDVASSSIHSAQQRVQSLSDVMIQELQKIQQASTSTLPSHLQHSLQDLTQNLHTTINDLSAILTEKDVPLSQKVGKISTLVQDRVHPVLEATSERVNVMISVVTGKVEKAKEETEETVEVAEDRGKSYAQAVQEGNGEASTANGNGHAQ